MNFCTTQRESAVMPFEQRYWRLRPLQIDALWPGPFPEQASSCHAHCEVVFTDDAYAALLDIARLDDFTRDYIATMIFTLTDDDGNPVDHLGAEDIERETLAAIVADCARFQAMHGETIDAAEHKPGSYDDTAREHAGRDLWYTRNGHGCGFWDGDWSEPHAEVLDTAAKAFGNVYMFVDDGQIHGC